MKSITEAERQIMEVVWETSPIVSEDIIARVARPNGWSDGTVRSLLNRLLNKKVLKVKREGRTYWYRPAVKREDFLTNESTGFLDRLFDGKLAPLVSHLAAHRKLSEEDIADLKKLIRKLDDGR
jgi:BlaI family transcriptional regulator, penicillinase repressor